MLSDDLEFIIGLHWIAFCFETVVAEREWWILLLLAKSRKIASTARRLLSPTLHFPAQNVLHISTQAKGVGISATNTAITTATELERYYNECCLSDHTANSCQSKRLRPTTWPYLFRNDSKSQKTSSGSCFSHQSTSNLPRNRWFG